MTEAPNISELSFTLLRPLPIKLQATLPDTDNHSAADDQTEAPKAAPRIPESVPVESQKLWVLGVEASVECSTNTRGGGAGLEATEAVRSDGLATSVTDRRGSLSRSGSISRSSQWPVVRGAISSVAAPPATPERGGSEAGSPRRLSLNNCRRSLTAGVSSLDLMSDVGKAGGAVGAGISKADRLKQLLTQVRGGLRWDRREVARGGDRMCEVNGR